MKLSRRQLLQLAATASAFGTLPSLRAQPLEQVKIVVGFTAGGTADLVGRRIAEKLSPEFGKVVLVDNRTGAGGRLAVTAVTSAPADGTTVLLTPMTMLGIYPHTYKKLQYDPVADLAPVAQVVSFDYGIAVGPAVPASVKTVPELLAWFKANPGQANFGTAAPASTMHFIGALLARSAQIDLRHIPYRGSQPALLEMVGGQLPAVVAPIGEFVPHADSGKCRVLATTGTTRSRFAPGAPTLAEQGFKDMVFSEWFGLFLPARTPAPIVQRLNAVVRKALAEAEFAKGLAANSLEAVSSTPEELAALLKHDTQRWGGLVKSIGFTPEA